MIHSGKFTMACALCTGILWVICSVSIALFPEVMLQMVAHMFHIDSEQLDWTLTWYGFLVGFLSWVTFASVAGLILSIIYNQLVCNESN